ncbi:MAG: glycoside hydrolase family 3 N-terminal domain-containing protein [Bacteroidota bacterium]
MRRSIILTCWISIASFITTHAQLTKSEWVDSIMNEMTTAEKIGQIFMIRAFSKEDPSHIKDVKRQIKDYQVGGICFFQGSPLKQAALTQEYQEMSDVPMMIGIDGEWGLGMRFPKDAISFPKQLTIGAINDHQLIYRMGKEIGRQCQLSGVNVNFAPAVDVNNNPLNPVINIRSFGEDPFNVAAKAYAYMKGLEDSDVMACAKHFPGHGDTDVDSHHDLPIIPHDRARLDSIELFPFQMMIRQGIPAVMTAHLSVPTLDSRENRPTTLSSYVVEDLLRDDMGFEGLAFTDAMEMKGVTKYYNPGEADVEAFLAGNDVILLPENMDAAMRAMKEAVASGIISTERLDRSVRRVLEAKYDMNLDEVITRASQENLMTEVNSKEAAVIKAKIYERALTLVDNSEGTLPLTSLLGREYGSISLGSTGINTFQQRLDDYIDVSHYHQSKNNTNPTTYDEHVTSLKDKDLVFVTIQDMSRYGSKNYGVDQLQINFIKQLASETKVILSIFGSPYAAKYFEDIATVLIAYEEDEMAQDAAAQAIMGAIDITGKLPVTASDRYPVGTGVKIPSLNRIGFALPEAVGLSSDTLSRIDDLVDELIQLKAAPGCQVLVAKDNKVVYHRSFGHHTYNEDLAVDNDDVFDLASVTKVLASTISAMHLQDADQFNPKDRIRQYIPEEDTTNKANIVYEDMLAHVAGLAAWIPFYAETLDVELDNQPSTSYYRETPSDSFGVMVTPSLYLRTDYPDTIWRKIFSSQLRETNEYRYSDLAFYITNKTINNLSGYWVDGYAEINFYNPMGLRRTMFNPYRILDQDDIVPTEHDQYWRNQIVDGTVHDMGAAMLGGVSGHAGLFSNAREVGVLLQMVLNGGQYGGRQYLKPETVEYYTRRHWRSTRRGIGWDMKELDPDRTLNISEKASRHAFGHLGFTGNSAFADPDHDLVFVFLSNRTFPTMKNNTLGKEDFRPRIQSVVYDALIP